MRRPQRSRQVQEERAQNRATSPARQFLGRIVIVVAFIGIIAIPVAAGMYLLRGSSSTGTIDNSTSIIDIGQALLAQLNIGDADVPAGTDPTPVTFSVKPGETALQIAKRLQEAGLVRNAGSFRALLRVQGVDKNLEAGEYKLRRNMTPREIMAVLQKGRPPTVTVTIPEGRRGEEIVDLLVAEGLANRDALLNLIQSGGDFNHPFLADRPIGRQSLEGYLFPDTYEFRREASARDIIDTLLKNFDRRFTPEMRRAAAQAGLNVDQVVILASIVEREAVLARERPMIASVYLNRLEQGIKLDADPTIQYAMGYDPATRTWWRALLLDDLQFKSPYNTYLNPGLPPGPICNPGLASLQAVIEPAQTNYLYFVANSVAGDGSHVFAATWEEHLQNIARYQP